MELIEVIDKLKPIYMENNPFPNKEKFQALRSDFIDPVLEVDTQELDEAIYVFEDGTLLHGGFYEGVRLIDHRVIEHLYDDMDRYTKNFWDIALNDIGAIMLVPETCSIIRWDNQKITEKQQEVLDTLINCYGYEEIIEHSNLLKDNGERS